MIKALVYNDTLSHLKMSVLLKSLGSPKLNNQNQPDFKCELCELLSVIQNAYIAINDLDLAP